MLNSQWRLVLTGLENGPGLAKATTQQIAPDRADISLLHPLTQICG
jgi:hypothetical protein